MSLMHPQVDLQRHELLQGCLAIGLGVDGVGFGLIRFTLGNTVVLDEILVQIGQAAQVCAVAMALR